MVCDYGVGRPYSAVDGMTKGNQGMLFLQLTDSKGGNVFIVACTHLKAKAGVDNDLTREHQVNALSKGQFVANSTASPVV